MDQGHGEPRRRSGNLCLGGTIGRAMGDQVVSTGTGSVNLPMSLCLPFNLGGRSRTATPGTSSCGSATSGRAA